MSADGDGFEIYWLVFLCFAFAKKEGAFLYSDSKVVH